MSELEDDEPNHEIEDEVDRISHGTPDSHIETHVSRTSREEAVRTSASRRNLPTNEPYRPLCRPSRDPFDMSGRAMRIL